MPRHLTLSVFSVTLVLCAAGGADAASRSTCTPRVDRHHIVKAGGATAFVKATKGGGRELVVRGVNPSLTRHDLEDQSECAIDLARFEARFRSAPHELHVRFRHTAVRVTSVHYDPATATLRTKGQIEHGPARASAAAAGCTTSPCLPVVVYSSTFIPFDSSF